MVANYYHKDSKTIKFKDKNQGDILIVPVQIKLSPIFNKISWELKFMKFLTTCRLKKLAKIFAILVRHHKHSAQKVSSMKAKELKV